MCRLHNFFTRLMPFHPQAVADTLPERRWIPVDLPCLRVSQHYFVTSHPTIHPPRQSISLVMHIWIAELWWKKRGGYGQLTCHRILLNKQLLPLLLLPQERGNWRTVLLNLIFQEFYLLFPFMFALSLYRCHSHVYFHGHPITGMNSGFHAPAAKVSDIAHLLWYADTIQSECEHYLHFKVDYGFYKAATWSSGWFNWRNFGKKLAYWWVVFMFYLFAVDATVSYSSLP